MTSKLLSLQFCGTTDVVSIDKNLCVSFDKVRVQYIRLNSKGQLVMVGTTNKGYTVLLLLNSDDGVVYVEDIHVVTNTQHVYTPTSNCSNCSFS